MFYWNKPLRYAPIRLEHILQPQSRHTQQPLAGTIFLLPHCGHLLIFIIKQFPLPIGFIYRSLVIYRFPPDFVLLFPITFLIQFLYFVNIILIFISKEHKRTESHNKTTAQLLQLNKFIFVYLF